jgi:hypothetical protein
MSETKIALEFGCPVQSYEVAKNIIEYLNTKHSDFEHFIKKKEDNKFIILFKVKKDKKDKKEIIIRI